MGAYTEEQVRILRERWKGYEGELEKLIPFLLDDRFEWKKSKVYLQVISKTPVGIGTVDLDLRGAPLYGTSLSGAKLHGVDLSGAEMGGTDLSKAELVGADLSKAFLDEANLSGAQLQNANLSGATLFQTNLSEAKLWNANLSRAVLGYADLSGAYMRYVNLSKAELDGIKYTTDEIFNRLRKYYMPKIFQKICSKINLKSVQKWKPIQITDFSGIDTSEINGSTNPVLKRHIEDYQFIKGFREKSWSHGKLFYPLWKYTSDSGRSLLLWLIWSVGFALFFGWLYSNHLYWFEKAHDRFNAFYFSVITFTTLGFGDITPKLDSHWAQGWVMAEVIIGYIMLGGLVSIFANKLARRA
jgi:uncharacterized protein YjbI with pentapeptide repeats